MKAKKPRQNTEDEKPRTNQPSGSKPAFEEVATCAYLIWEQEGRPAGREMEHWFEAERHLAAAQERSL
jgi:Protein of unknown function (DUF2934)